MKKKFHVLLSLFVLASMLLGACQPAAPVVEEAEPEAAVEEAEAEEAEEVEEAEEAEAEEEMEEVEEEEPEVVEPAGPDALDAEFSAMLDAMAAYNTIKADALLEEMAADTPPFLLDVRTTAELEESGHIEGATHIPLSELAQHIDLLPDFDTPIVAYCGSGWRATIAMTALHGMGWTDVRTLKALYTDWVDAGNPVVEGVPEPMVLDVAQPDPALVEAVDAALVDIKSLGAKFGIKTADELNADLAEKPDLILIDVRRTEELEEKGILGVEGQTLLTIPLEEFMAQQDMWPESMDAEVVIYCGSGHRSTMAMTMMLSYGYTNVTSLKGGFGGWAEAGYPVAEFAAP